MRALELTNETNQVLHDYEHFQRATRRIIRGLVRRRVLGRCLLMSMHLRSAAARPPDAEKREHLGTGDKQSCCSQAPCFVATEHDLMNFTEFLNRLAPAVIAAGIIKITVPEELRVKFLSCTKPSGSFPCKEQMMRYSSKRAQPGFATLVGHHVGNSATTTIESIQQHAKELQSSLGYNF